MPSVELTPIISYYSDDPEMAELVDEFVNTLSERVISLENCLNTGDLSELKRIAHQLKGSCGGYGFDVIGQAAAILETSAKASQSVEQVNQEVADLIQLCQRAKSGTA
ncbi:MAG: Hpt domain-containing protein [Phycisphaerales bacterium]|nr:Hpt domain-containing protein [Phycisphaerales bacterium]